MTQALEERRHTPQASIDCSIRSVEVQRQRQTLEDIFLMPAADRGNTPITEEHFNHLVDELGSAARACHAVESGVRSLTEAQARAHGFRIMGEDKRQHSSSGLYFPFSEGFGQLRCDVPPLNRNGEPAKYLNRSDVPQAIATIGDGEPSLATEGWKDAARLHHETGESVAAIAGVHGWKKLPTSVQAIIYDADALANPGVWSPLLKAGFSRRVQLAFFSAAVAGPKGGACEYFRNGGSYGDIKKWKARSLLSGLPDLWGSVRSDWVNFSLKSLLRIAHEQKWSTVDLDVLAKRACQKLKANIKFARHYLEQLKAQRKEERLAAQAFSGGIPQTASCPKEPNRRELQDFLRCSYDIRFNVLSREVELNGHPMEQIDLADCFLAHIHDLEVGKDVARSTFLYLAKSAPFNPVEDYFNLLRTSRHLRLLSITELGDAFGLDSGDRLSQELLARHLTGALLRGLEPGYKHDQILILSGEQGTYKSTAIAALAPEARWYDAATDVKGLEDKDFLTKINGSWLFEFEEIEHALTKRSAPEFKGFITRQDDRYVEKYESRTSTHPRRPALFGTTNDSQILSDHTGDRRIWLIQVVKPCQPDWIKANRDSIWATIWTWHEWGLSSFLRYGEASALAASKRAQAARISDPWEGLVRDALEKLSAETSINTGIAQDSIFLALGFEPAQMDRRSQMRMTQLVTGEGFYTHQDGSSALRWKSDRGRFPSKDLGRPAQSRAGYKAVRSERSNPVPTSEAGGWYRQMPWERKDLREVFQPFQPSPKESTAVVQHNRPERSTAAAVAATAKRCSNTSSLERLEQPGRSTAATGVSGVPTPGELSEQRTLSAAQWVEQAKAHLNAANEVIDADSIHQWLMEQNAGVSRSQVESHHQQEAEPQEELGFAMGFALIGSGAEVIDEGDDPAWGPRPRGQEET